MKKTLIISVFSLFLFSIPACKKKAGPAGPQGEQGPPGPGFKHYIGEKFGGGLVFYVFRDSLGVEHGLIVANKDLGFAPWSNQNVDVPGCESRSNGAANTKQMLSAGAVATDAAGLCSNYRGGGFSDWFLPALDQLNMLDYAAYNINLIVEEDKSGEYMPIYLGEIFDYYWSSTEKSASEACGFKYVASITTKSKTWRVRPVRAF